jgi:hypothetical protein
MPIQNSRRLSRGFFPVALAAAILGFVGSGLSIYDLIRSEQQRQDGERRMHTLETKVDELQKRFAAASAKPVDQPPASASRPEDANEKSAAKPPNRDFPRQSGTPGETILTTRTGEPAKEAKGEVDHPK